MPRTSTTISRSPQVAGRSARTPVRSWDGRARHRTPPVGAGLLLRSFTALSNIDPALPLSNVSTFDEIVSASTASRRFTVVLLSAFAAIALALPLVGISGVTAYSASRPAHLRERRGNTDRDGGTGLHRPARQALRTDLVAALRAE